MDPSIKTFDIDPFSIQSYPVGGSLGFGMAQQNIGFRVEAEYLYRFKGDSKGVRVARTSSQTSDGSNLVIDMNLKTQSQSILGNMYLDFYLTPSFSLYLSSGVGVVLLKSKMQMKRNDGQVGEFNKNDRTLTWQAGLGMNYAVAKNLRLDLNARYVSFGTRKIAYGPVSMRVSLGAIEGLVGLTYQF